VGSLQDSESVLASSVPDGDGIALLVNIAVLSNSLTVAGGLLSEDGTVLLGEGSAMAAISGVKSLLFQDFGILWFNKLTASRSYETGGCDESQHVDNSNFLTLLAKLK